MQRSFLTALIVLLVFGGEALAQSLDLTQTYLNPGTPPISNDIFGQSVAGAGNRALVGAPQDDTGAPDAGAAYLFDTSTGALVRTFLNPAPEEGDQFGYTVAMVGSNVLIGAPFKDANAGAIVDAGVAYLFDGATGFLLQTIVDPTPADDEQFGIALASLGNNVLVGSPFQDLGANVDAGVAYLFDSNTGALLQTFANPTPATEDNFGRALAGAGNHVLVGSPNDDTGASNSGAAYLFDANDGSLTFTLLNPTPADLDVFGNAVAAAGNDLIVAASSDDAGAGNAGAVYLFSGMTGALHRTFLNPAPGNDTFGAAVAVVGSSGLVLVGTPLDDPNDSGTAYLFNGTTGALVQTFNNPADASGDQFGFSVAAIGNKVLVGTPNDDASGTNSGIAYLYTSPNEPPIANAGTDQTLACASPAGTPATLDGSGSNDPDNDQLTYTWRENGNIVAGPTNDPTSVVTFGPGGHTVELTVDDGNGEIGIDVVLITIVDTAPPAITLNGANPMTVVCHNTYSEPGAAVSDACDSSPGLVITGTVNSNVPGTYTISYTATDANGNNATTTRTVNVVDTTPPAITVNGDNPMTLECSNPYSEPGAAVSDACDASPGLVITGTVNSNVPGTYTITYTATDANGNNATTTRTVNVVDTMPPAITVNGDNPMTLECSNPYSEPGAAVSDACDSSPGLVITGTVNSNVSGTYTITYTATDANGNSASTTRSVNVECSLPYPFVLLAEDKVLIGPQLSSEGDIHSNDDLEFREGNPSIHTGNLTAVDNIQIKRDNTIDGDVTAGGNIALENNSTITGTATSHAAVEPYPLPTFSFTAGNANVTVPASGSLGLAPGSYHDIKVEVGGNLLLAHDGSSGVYFLHKLELKTAARLSIDVSQGPVEINLVEKLHFDKDVEIVIAPSAAGSSRLVTFNLMSNQEVHIHDRSNVSGTINAPDSKVILFDAVFFKGAVSGKEIEVRKNVTCLHHNSSGSTSLPKSSTSAADDAEESNESETAAEVRTYQLEQNYPNPFNPETEIRFQLPEASHAVVKIFNTLGAEIRTLADGSFAAGFHSLRWDGRNHRGEKVQSGIYFCRLATPKFSATKKMILTE